LLQSPLPNPRLQCHVLFSVTCSILSLKKKKQKKKTIHTYPVTLFVCPFAFIGAHFIFRVFFFFWFSHLSRFTIFPFVFFMCSFPCDRFLVTAVMQASTCNRSWPQPVDDPHAVNPGGTCVPTHEPSLSAARCNYAAELGERRREKKKQKTNKKKQRREKRGTKQNEAEKWMYAGMGCVEAVFPRSLICRFLRLAARRREP
jgi:hypothetical protein